VAVLLRLLQSHVSVSLVSRRLAAVAPQVLTGDQGGTLCVWSVHTGRLRLKLPYVHGEHQRISAMCLDHNCRRLFTASEGGPIKVGTGCWAACAAGAAAAALLCGPQLPAASCEVSLTDYL
jgi:hypothetical protein